MSDEILPEGQQSDWSSLLEELNLPKLLLGPAGQALSRLVGHVADVPAEYVKSFTQVIKDKRDARTEVSKALSAAVAKEVAGDSELIKRATQSLLAKELRAQTNKEEIAKKVVDHLHADLEAEDSNPQAPDEDWFNVFEQYAENASSEKLRDLWSRVLAKQIRKPKSFSLRTMRFVSELDMETAALFEKHSGSIINRQYIVKPPQLEGQTFGDLLDLEHAGLLTGVQGNVSQGFRNPTVGALTELVFMFANSAVIVNAVGPYNVNLPVIALTTIGKEILAIVEPSDGLESARILAEMFPKNNVTAVRYGKLTEGRNGIEDAITVFEAAPAQAPDKVAE